MENCWRERVASGWKISRNRRCAIQSMGCIRGSGYVVRDMKDMFICADSVTGDSRTWQNLGAKPLAEALESLAWRDKDGKNQTERDPV